MSLGAKELFHTNFLSYLLESREPGLSRLQLSLRDIFGIAQKENEEAWCFTYRELSSLDLIIVPVKRLQRKNAKADEEGDDRDFQPSGSTASVIEAKLKAISTIGQLERYDKKLSRGVRIQWQRPDGTLTTRAVGLSNNASTIPVKRWLLTADDREPNAITWNRLPWTSIATCIGNFATTADRQELGSTICEVISDYAKHLTDLLFIVHETGTLYRNSRERPYTEFLASLLRFEQLQAARLGDLVGKRAYSDWLVDILTKLAIEIPEASGPSALASEVFLTNGLPGITVEWSFASSVSGKTSLRIGVQIQGKNYRHFVGAKQKWDGLEEFVVTSGLLKSWMAGYVQLPAGGQALMAQRPRHLPPVPPVEVIHGKRVTNLRKFNENAFLYSDVDLFQGDTTLAAIEDAVCASMKHAAALASAIGQ